jgi:RND family efflux transporter MFP subunit
MMKPSSLAPAAAALALLALGACGGKPASEPRPQTVAGERYVVRQVLVPDLKPVAASVTTQHMAEARARIGGTLVRLNVKEGDLVRQGQAIGLVVDQRIGLETRAYDAQVGAAQAEADRAQADLARTRDLYDHGVYAKARMDLVEAQAKAAAGALGAARAQRAASAESGAQGAILAPADGRVLQIETPAGSVVAPGQGVASLTAGAVVVRIEAPEADMHALKVGQTLSASLDDPAQPTIAAVVAQIYPAVAAGRVTADLAAPGLGAQFVGQRVRVSLPIGQRPALIVPARLVATRYGVDYVRLLGNDGQAGDAPVQTAPTADRGTVEILSGLAPGDVLTAPGAGR